MFNWPNDLVSDIARRTCVLYIGAGVSANSSSAKGISPPTWEAFLRSCLTKINKADCAYIESCLFVVAISSKSLSSKISKETSPSM